MNTIFDTQSLLTYAICSIALALNFLLFIVYFCCPLRKGNSYRYFFVLSAIQDMIFAALLMLTIPKVVSQESCFIFVSTGWVGRLSWGYVPLLLYCISFFSTLLLVTNGFLHRYLQLCRKDVFRRYSSIRNTIIAICSNIALLLAVLIAIYITVWPSAHFKKLVQTIDFYGLDLERSSFIGFSMKHSVTPINLILIFNVMLLTGILLWIDILCAVLQIQVRKLFGELEFIQAERKLQAAAPIILLQVPYAISIFYLFTGKSTTPFTSAIIGALLAFHPLIDPVLILAFVKDYRIYILSKLDFRKSVIALAPKNNAVADEVPQIYIGSITAISR